MKDSWLLATSLVDTPQRVVALYGRRFTCEENFRDEKDSRFGLGSRLVRVRDAARRDRLCFILAVAAAFLTLLGAAGEKLGRDRLLRANTVKRRTHSLFRQGREYLRDLLADTDSRAPLVVGFQEARKNRRGFPARAAHFRPPLRRDSVNFVEDYIPPSHGKAERRPRSPSP
jgi:hypothetical protein